MSKQREESEELDRFTRKHRRKTGIPEEYEEEKEISESVSMKTFEKDPEMATAYIEFLKCRSRRAATINSLKTKMQKTLLSELWERMAEEQERAFDREIASQVLDQSRYEKQILTKLCEVREQQNIMVENQRILENMTLETNELEHRASVERETNLASRAQKEVDIECQRMCELRQKLREEKIRRVKEKHWEICSEVVNDMVDLAMKITIYRETTGEHVPRIILREWETLFLGCQPIFEQEMSINLDEIWDEEETEDIFEEMSEAKLGKMETLQEGLFDDYLEANAPWDEFLPMLAEDAQEMLDLGRAVFGFVVHRLLNYLRADRSHQSVANFLTEIHPRRDNCRRHEYDGARDDANVARKM